jgi:arylsulfatase
LEKKMNVMSKNWYEREWMCTMTFVRFTALFSLFLLAFAPLSLAQPPVAKRPNIVMILLDDAGYSDLGAFGGEIETPHIDRIAEEGILFTQFHVTPNCSSTRAALLTGMDHHRTGFGTHGLTATNQKGKPGYEGFLNRQVVTLAEVLRIAGYRTMMAGKWHLGNRDPGTWPSGRGFDDSFALLNGGASHWDNTPLFPSRPSVYVENGKPVKQFPAQFYSSDFFTSKIIEYVESSDKPFFAFLSFTAPHNPLHAPAELIQKYKNIYTHGWDALQLRRLEGLKSRGMVAASVKPQQRPGWIPSWNSLDDSARQIAARDMAVYAAMIDSVDQNIGRLVDRLQKLNKYDNTLILVFSDNGPSKTTIADYLALDGEGAKFLERFNNKLDNRGLPGSNVDIGPGWAYGIAAPFRLMKGYQTQGGVISPLIVKPPVGWNKPTQYVRTPIHVMDIMPTFIEVAGANHPGTRSGNEILPMQGSSLTDLIQGVNDTFFSQRGFGSELFGIRAYRLGNWKILKLPPPYGTGNWQLYNLSTDPGETTDLASKHPGRLKELAKSWQAYAKENGVVEPDKLTLYAKPPR